MARVICAVVLLTLTTINFVSATSKECEGKRISQQCGEYRACICPYFNFVTFFNKGEGSRCAGDRNLVCRDVRCITSGRYSEPKKVNGEYVSCSNDSECGTNYECRATVCCHKPGGKTKQILEQ